ncbi:acyltransferase [Flavobacterium sp.]|uniref:acyltransferase n=1 Tax=Flavobacterium sp. TaxID=239 RepID=UPI002BD6876A|nr:acyltransferase [Flavobacterium sp.]HSD06043.1 acyltransferase [Flavobacterium sp.]
MKFDYFFQQSFFLLRKRYLKKAFSFLRKSYYQLQGMKVGERTLISKIYCTWPHQVSLGINCTVEQNVFFKYDNIWKKEPSIIIGNNVFIGSGCEFNITEKISIGDNSLVASGTRFVDHDHGMAIDRLICKQPSTSAPIIIENNVWIGANVVVLKGVKIEEGAVIAAGAVVRESIRANEIWGGVPAKKIGLRK